jgi:glycosyltransferase involved in cell wall biosynthesis
MRKISILFVEFHSNGGSVNGLLAELEYLKANHSQEFETVVIGPPDSILREHSNAFDFFYAKKTYELSEMYDHFLRTLYNYFSTIFFITFIVLKHHIVRSHCNNYFWSPHVNPVGFILRKQVIVHLKDVLLLEPKIARVLMKFNKRTIYIAVSQYVKKLFTTKYKVRKEKIVTIYDGIDSKIFTFCGEKRAQKKFEQPNKKIIMISRVAPTRNIEVFIDTAALLAKKYPKLIFLHHGYLKGYVDEEYFSTLKKRVKSLNLEGQFIFENYKSDRKKITKLLQSSFLSIVPATNFALPNTLIESMMCGTPGVANDVGGNSEIIINESLGKLIPSNSPLLFVKSIEYYLRNKAAYLKASVNGSKIAHLKFSAEKIYGEFLSLYKNLLGK